MRPKTSAAPRARCARSEPFVRFFSMPEYTLDDIPTFTHAPSLFPAQQQAVENPLDAFIEHPHQKTHHRDEGEDDTGHLDRLFARGPRTRLTSLYDSPAKLRVRRPGSLNHASNAATTRPPTNTPIRATMGCASSMENPTMPAITTRTANPELDPVSGTGNGFYAGIRHFATRARRECATRDTLRRVAGAVGIEPQPSVLETDALPIELYPKTFKLRVAPCGSGARKRRLHKPWTKVTVWRIKQTPKFRN